MLADTLAPARRSRPRAASHSGRVRSRRIDTGPILDTGAQAAGAAASTSKRADLERFACSMSGVGQQKPGVARAHAGCAWRPAWWMQCGELLLGAGHATHAADGSGPSVSRAWPSNLRWPHCWTLRRRIICADAFEVDSQAGSCGRHGGMARCSVSQICLAVQGALSNLKQDSRLGACEEVCHTVWLL